MGPPMLSPGVAVTLVPRSHFHCSSLLSDSSLYNFSSLCVYNILFLRMNVCPWGMRLCETLVFNLGCSSESPQKPKDRILLSGPHPLDIRFDTVLD